ncbi:MAG: transketolase [Candidatus Taylorbacteria bacterium CG10_big_fil_rev_8_21_14_0_10_41_48]|uniref:Transketolase n=1 Tax=Candidatus Taylorbacteria bacterium CG10_big_fil_rev_8_21_14_0_10_41_48 TaxID=1975024 RepID=A0A2M8LCJ8_9BACT|nr:MAG: transketolase [Candidatus Taylorbacteria bacterium CG10_big_fil_rev_8_21_14_0_10_41_48]
MINPSQKLNPKIFDTDVEMIPIRKGFGEGLLASAEKNENIIGLCADLTESTQMHLFKNKFPERFVEIGVAEQNLATVASGMAAMGKIPFISSYAMFSPGRNWEQIRTTIAYNDRPVKIIGSHAGVSVGPDGGTHQAIEDIALMRVIPNMIVISPCDAIEAKKATIEASNNGKPTYIRLAREKTPVITTLDTPFEIGKAQIVFQPVVGKSDAVIIATGALLHRALLVAKDLEHEKKAVTVINLSTIKPLDKKTILSVVREAGAVVTVEEHQLVGGVGSAIAELLAKEYTAPIEFIGIDDRFGQSGTPEELLTEYGMSHKNIKEAVIRVIKRK